MIPNPWDVGSARAWTGFMRAAQTLKSEGSLAGLVSLVPYAQINGLFTTDRPGHQADGE